MAIINNKHKFIFVHIPKNAGTSISKYYSQITTVADVEIGGSAIGEAVNSLYSQAYHINKHTPARRFHASLGESFYKSFTTFCFVRNPFTRTVSTFNFLNKWLPEGGPEEHARVFEKFNDVNDMIASDYWNTPGVDNIFRSQLFWSHDVNGNRMVDFIGKVESLNEDIRLLNEKIGIDLEEMSFRSNESSTYSLVDHLTADSIQKILNRYNEDFKHFGYKPSIET